MEFLLGTVLAGLSLITLPVAADPFQPVRALLAGAAVLGCALLLRTAGELAGLKLPAALAAVLAALYGAAAIAGGIPSGLFGVHGRYQGLVAGALYLAVGAAGAIILKRNIFALVWPIAGAATIHSLIVIAQRLSDAPPTSNIGNQVLAGGWLAVATSTLFAAALVSRGNTRLALACIAGLSAVGVGLCGSRGAWVGLVIAAFVAVAVLRSRRSVAVLAGVVVAVVLGAALLGGPAALSKLDPGQLTGGSAASRWQIWRGTARMIAANPVLGVGPGRFIYEFPAYEPFERAALEYGDVRADQAHSELLQVASEAGAPAVLALVALLSVVLARGYRGARSKSGTAFIGLVGLSAAVGQGLFGITTVETAVLAWALGGVLAWRLPEATSATKASANSGKSSKPARPVVVATAPGDWWVKTALGLTGAAVVLASGAYLAADADYARGLDLFSAGRFQESVAAHRAAQRLIPMVDNFRIAEADAAFYLRGDYLSQALSSAEKGLALEPKSYDLMLARARLLMDLGRPASEVADAYVSSVELYPLGVEVRTEAVQVLYAANRDAEAAAIQQDLMRLQEAAGRGHTP